MTIGERALELDLDRIVPRRAQRVEQVAVVKADLQIVDHAVKRAFVVALPTAVMQVICT